MAFLRTKRVKGIDYLYLVEGRRVGGKVIQKVIKYLGPARRQDLRVQYLTSADLTIIHDSIITRYGGEKGTIDSGYLDFVTASSMVRHETATTRRERILRKAAHLLFGIVSRHPFLDGNKRTGFEAAEQFLRINGFKIACSVEDGRNLAFGISTGQVRAEAEVADWLTPRIRRTHFRKGLA